MLYGKIFLFVHKPDKAYGYASVTFSKTSQFDGVHLLSYTISCTKSGVKLLTGITNRTTMWMQLTYEMDWRYLSQNKYIVCHIMKRKYIF